MGKIPKYTDSERLMTPKTDYRIAGKFGEEFNLANWRGILKNAKLKIANFEIYTLNGMRPQIFVSRESTSAGIRQI